MNITLEEVIHLYLGCMVQMNDGSKAILICYDNTTKQCTLATQRYFTASISDNTFKPILRTLQSMTIEDAIHLWGLQNKHFFLNEERYPDTKFHPAFNFYNKIDTIGPYGLLYITGRHYDLFKLIETNQALAQ